MYRFIYHRWWKVVTLLLLLYVFIAGFLVPLKPGIFSVSELQLERGVPFSIEVTTYNTKWDKADQLVAYVRYDSSHLWKVPEIAISDRNSLIISGILPAWKSSYESEFDDLSLILHHEKDGFLILPSAFVSNGPSDGAEPVWVTQIPEYGKWAWKFPFQAILYETIRNTFFHVAIWMAMFVLLVVSLVYSIKYLLTRDIYHDAVASAFGYVGIVWGTMGMITGSLWGKAAWGAYWTNDPKLNMSAVAMMIYLAYAILRASINSEDRRAQLSSAYNIFAFLAMIPLIFIIPRLDSMSSMHPGNGGNPALGGEDLDSTLRLVFYPAIIGYTLLGVWMSSLLFRLRKIELNQLYAQLKK